MLRHIVLCGVVTGAGWGCGFQGNDAPNGRDGGADSGSDAGDAGGSGDGSGSETGDCFAHWLDGSVAIDTAAVQELATLTPVGIDDRNPWISDNGLHLYFERNPGMQGSGDVYFSARTTTTDPFTTANQVTNLNTNLLESRAWFTPDELSYALASDREGRLQIYIGKRNTVGDPFGSPDRVHLNMVNGTAAATFDPFLSSDGLRLYFAANSGPSGKLQIHFATRTSTTGDFGPPSMVPGTSNNSSNLADPAVYQGERLLLFSAIPTGSGQTGDLWYATRATTADDFGTPAKIPNVNSGADDFDPVLSADGCELYFASTRNGGKFHLFRAQVTR